MKLVPCPIMPAVRVALVLGACADAGATGAAPDPCAQLSVASLEGEWSVTAKGTRDGCDGERVEGDIDLSVQPFIVYAKEAPPTQHDAGTEADAFLWRVRHAPIVLTTSISDDNVAFEGAGSGCSLFFRISETLSAESVLDYHFVGTMDDGDRASGTFTGSGPGECRSRGQFTVTRR